MEAKRRREMASNTACFWVPVFMSPAIVILSDFIDRNYINIPESVMYAAFLAPAIAVFLMNRMPSLRYIFSWSFAQRIYMTIGGLLASVFILAYIFV